MDRAREQMDVDLIPASLTRETGTNETKEDVAMEHKLSLPTELPRDFAYTRKEGLNEQEARAQMQAGKANVMDQDQGKTLGQILAGNLFTFFNFLNLGLAAALFFVGSYRNMLFLGVVIINALIGTLQEYKAQKAIQKLKLLNAPSVHVLRDGKETVCAPEETVEGDLVVLHGGDQVAADAIVIEGQGSAMESLLTGESNAIPKEAGSWLYSGSYITEGRIIAQQVYVGGESYAGRLTREAKKAVRPGSKLKKELDRLIRVDGFVLLPLGVLLLLKQTLLAHMPLTEAVPASVAAMIGMIPEGLVLLTSIAMAVGVRKLGKKQALVQELAGIETLARADVLCLDKTGTITTGEMTLEAMEGVDADEQEFWQAMARFLGAFDDQSGTLNALRRAVAPGEEKPESVLPFSSKRKKSAAMFGDGTALVLGAPEFVLGDMFPSALRRRVNEWTDEGKRVLVLAENRGPVRDDIPPRIKRVLGLCALTEQIRPGAADALAYFKSQGVAVKVISGDNPHTVSQIARAAGLEGWQEYIDASTLNTDEALEEACEKYTVFGRVTPEQKKALVLALKKKGHNVAMTGDGVNDIPALKAADCSIAMAGGSDAARNAAQLTLLTSDFTVMPDIVLEGRQVINNITRTASLFLMKTLFSFGLSVLMLFFPGAYPFQPIQMTLVSSMMIGFPGFILSLEPSRERISGSFLRTVIIRALPGALAVTVCAAAAMTLTGYGWDRTLCSTLATWLAGLIGYLVLLLTCLPLNLIRSCLLGAVAIGFTGAALLFHKVFFLVPLTSQAGIAMATLGALGCGIVLVSRYLVKRFGLEKGTDAKIERGGR